MLTCAASLRFQYPVVRCVPHIPIACHANRQTDMSARQSCPVFAGRKRMLLSGLLQTVSSKSRMLAIRCYQSCRRLPSTAQKNWLHRLQYSHQTPPRQGLYQSVLLQRQLDLVLARRLSFSLRWKALQNSSPSCIWHSRCTCGFSPRQPSAGRRENGVDAFQESVGVLDDLVLTVGRMKHGTEGGPVAHNTVCV